MVRALRKEDLVRVHALLVQVRHGLEKAALVASDAFREYDAYGITPLRVDASKSEHTRAVFLLGNAISNALGMKHHIDFQHIPQVRL